MSDDDRYRQELEEFEGGNAGRSNIVVPFDTEERAQTFADYLREALGIETTPKYVSNSSVDPSTSSSQWDMDIPGAHLFKVKLLYTLFQTDNTRLADIPKRPMATRRKYLIDRLVGTAILRGKWSDHLCSQSDLTWYCDGVGIDRKEIPNMVAEAKETFLAQRASEKKWSTYLGVALLVAGGLAHAAGHETVGYALMGTGGVFAIFSLTR